MYVCMRVCVIFLSFVCLFFLLLFFAYQAGAVDDWLECLGYGVKSLEFTRAPYPTAGSP